MSRWFAAAVAVSIVPITGLGTAASASTRAQELRRFDGTAFRVLEGTLLLEFDRDALEELDWTLASRGGTAPLPDGLRFLFPIDPSAAFEFPAADGAWPAGFAVGSQGSVLIGHSAGRVAVGNPSINETFDGGLVLDDMLAPEETERTRFELRGPAVRVSREPLSLTLDAELIVADDLAREIGNCDAGGRRVGRARLWARFVAVEGAGLSAKGRSARDGACEAVAARRAEGAAAGEGGIGPDVVVADLQSVVRFGRVGDITSYAVGTHACNVGDERASWVSYTNKHPVIMQSMFRLKDDRFEHIGLSWMKHGFFAVSDCLCGGCAPSGGCADPTSGSQLGVWCSDAYSASLNGQYSNMSPRSDLNPTTGLFPYPWSAPPSDATIGRRLQVHDADIDPDLNADAAYFVEGHYITADDAAAGNDWNNASYRSVNVNEFVEENFAVTPTGLTQRGRPGIRAWRDHDPDVVEVEVPVPGEGMFIVSAKTTELGSGLWRYEYAVQNLNSDRAAASFSVQIPSGAGFANLGFHDVDYHSGEPYDLTDWPAVVEEEHVTWATTPYATDPHANALRWGTLYNFRFEANVEPVPNATVTIGLFKPGQPTEVQAMTVGPAGGIRDCNDNEIPDVCDVGCDAPDCGLYACGGSVDCNENLIPDECEADCNHNQVEDSCDIDNGGALDCNRNRVPDECDPDCDGDGVPDACDVPEDSDGDGVTDCLDHCRFTTPPGACACPALDMCCFLTGICIPDYPRVTCIEQGGQPDCLAAPCRDGCLLGDTDDDGDLDLADWSWLQWCLAAHGVPQSAVMPEEECVRVFDFDDSTDLGQVDCASFIELLSGPRDEGM